jgi:hypothetical protein
LLCFIQSGEQPRRSGACAERSTATGYPVYGHRVTGVPPMVPSVSTQGNGCAATWYPVSRNKVTGVPPHGTHCVDIG